MTGILVRTAGLVAIYLLVLTSTAPGDVLTGALIAVPIAVALSPSRSRRGDAPALARAWAALGLLAQTALELIVGTGRVVRFCLGARATPGLVEIPRGDRSRTEAAYWGLLTGEAPDEIVVDVDERRGALIVHLVDASDPAAVRERHQRSHERWRRRLER